MATEQPKATPPTPEHSTYVSPPPPVAYPHFNGSPYGPPPGAYPGFYPYAAPADGANGENGTGTAPPGYMMFSHPPPGMVFAFPPPQNPGYTAPQPPAAPPALRPKRKQVKMACTNCAAACKRCDENRPCERCRKYGITDTCVDGQRKERKKGIKRGPYKRKNKGGDEGASPQFADTSGAEGGEWPAGAAPPSTTPATTAAAIQAVAHQFPNGEAFYHPIYYPPHGPGPFLAPPPPPEGADGSPSQPSGQPVPYYIGAYPPPFGHYPPFLHGAPPPSQPSPQAPVQPGAPLPTTVDPAATSSSAEGKAVPAGGTAVAAGENGKKRTRASKSGTAGSKPKKVKRRDKGSKEGESAAAAPEAAGKDEAEVDVEAGAEDD